MAMTDTQRGAAIAMAFAHSQGRDPEGGLPQDPQNQSHMEIEMPGPGNIPPKMGPVPPTEDPYLKWRTSQA